MKLCRTCGTPKSARYCKRCKAAQERERYSRNATKERARKRAEYARKTGSDPIHAVQDAIIIGERKRMATKVECDHSAAMQERPGCFFCPLCGEWFDIEGNEIADPTESAQAETSGEPNPKKDEAREKKTRAYKRDESLKITVKCSHQGCTRQWKIWPQQETQNLECPQIHRPLRKLEQARQRQIRFRQNHR